MAERDSGIKFIYDEAAVIVPTPDGECLVIGDLHIGAEQGLVEKGFKLYDYTNRMAGRVSGLMDEFGLKNLIILGDVKDTVLYPKETERDALRQFFGALEAYKIRITTGNHDPHLSEIIPIETEDEIIIGNLAFMHGHRWPSDRAMRCRFIFAGHNHTAIRIKDRRGAVYTQKAWLIAALDREISRGRYVDPNSTIRLVILPAFNDLILGMPISPNRAENLSPLLRNGVFNYANAQVYSTRGELVGTPESMAVRGGRQRNGYEVD